MCDAANSSSHHLIFLGTSGVMGPGPYLISYYHHTGALPIFHPVFLCGLRDQRHWSLFILRDVDRLCRRLHLYTLSSLSLQSRMHYRLYRTCICRIKETFYAHVI